MYYFNCLRGKSLFDKLILCVFIMVIFKGYCQLLGFNLTSWKYPQIQAKIRAKWYSKNELIFTKAEQSNQKWWTETIFGRKFLKNFLSYLHVFYEYEARYVAVFGCGDMGSSAVLSKLQMLFVAFMGQIPSSWLQKHSPARCRVFLIFILFKCDQINFFLKFVLAKYCEMISLCLFNK